jgi:predicted DNA-binding transcriptional regulator YafY
LAKRPFNNHLFRHIAAATLARKRLLICYRGRGKDRLSEREVSPQRLVHYRDNWYLDAWCHVSDALRTFAVERVEKACKIDASATAISEQTLDDYLSSAFGIFSGPAKHIAMLRFTPERARWVAEEEWHPEQSARWLEDGSYELRIPYGNPTELIMDILKYGADVEVIDPASLRSAVKQRTLEMAKRYPEP